MAHPMIPDADQAKIAALHKAGGPDIAEAIAEVMHADASDMSVTPATFAASLIEVHVIGAAAAIMSARHMERTSTDSLEELADQARCRILDTMLGLEAQQEQQNQGKP